MGMPLPSFVRQYWKKEGEKIGKLSASGHNAPSKNTLFHSVRFLMAFTSVATCRGHCNRICAERRRDLEILTYNYRISF